ncbi:MAG: YegS/Rv2252/BmrU family lipid kinase [Bacilli bacterium]|nr:YegS/Rv2252/BmrU family lipid kinase [Bacilli bacterium]
MKKCSIICNIHSGKGIKKKTLNKFENILRENDYLVETYITKYQGHAKKIMQNIDYADLVISLGGDGTFNEVMTGNFKRKERLLVSHIPLGTTNDIGKMFGLNKNVLSNLKLILNGKVKKIDICTLNGHPFVYVAGFGKFMNIPYETSSSLKKRMGYLAYLINGIKDFIQRTRLSELSYTVNGKTYSGLYSFMIASSATRIAGINNIFKDVKLDDDQFEVLFCNLTKKKDIIKSLYYLKTSDITQVPGFYFHKTNNLTIKFKKKSKPWCVDGEKYDNKTREYNIKVVRNVEMLLPTKELPKLFLDEENKDV